MYSTKAIKRENQTQLNHRSEQVMQTFDMPSCQAFLDASSSASNDHNRYGILPSTVHVKRKLFADEEEGMQRSQGIPCPSGLTYDYSNFVENPGGYSSGYSNFLGLNMQPQVSVPQQIQMPQQMTRSIPQSLPRPDYTKMGLGNGISQIAIRKKHNDAPNGEWNNEVRILFFEIIINFLRKSYFAVGLFLYRLSLYIFDDLNVDQCPFRA